MSNDSENSEDISLRRADFIPIIGAINYCDRVSDYDSNGARYDESSFRRSMNRMSALGIYNTIIIGGSISGLMASLDNLIR